MASEKISIELTPEQLEKVKILEDNNISVGEAIDILFDVKEQIESSSSDYFKKQYNEYTNRKNQIDAELEDVTQKLDFYNKLMDKNVSIHEKQEIVEKEYGTHEKTYDEEVMDFKHDVSWGKIFKSFKF